MNEWIGNNEYTKKKVDGIRSSAMKTQANGMIWNSMWMA